MSIHYPEPLNDNQAAKPLNGLAYAAYIAAGPGGDRHLRAINLLDAAVQELRDHAWASGAWDIPDRDQPF